MGKKLQVELKNNVLHFGNFYIALIRTFRVPDTSKTYKLPKGTQYLPLHRVDDFDNVPDSWKKHGGVFTVMNPNDAMYINFGGLSPHAVKVGFGKVNALTGNTWTESVTRTQDYCVAPRPQYWLDGINIGDGVIRQIVATELGARHTIEGQVTGSEDVGGLQFVVYPNKNPNILSERIKVYNDYHGLWEKILKPDPLKPHTITVGDVPHFSYTSNIHTDSLSLNSIDTSSYVTRRTVTNSNEKGLELGIAAGGKIEQKIYPDPYGNSAWDYVNRGRVFVHIASPELYKEITGRNAPIAYTEVDYKAFGVPFVSLNDDFMGDIEPSGTLKKVKSMGQIAMDSGDELDTNISDDKFDSITYYQVRDGEW